MRHDAWIRARRTDSGATSSAVLDDHYGVMLDVRRCRHALDGPITARAHEPR